MNFRLLSRLVIAGAFGCGSLGCGSSLKEFRSSKGKYSVVFPGTPETDEQKEKIHIASVQQRDGMYAVLFVDATVPLADNDDVVRRRLDACRKSLLDKSKLELKGETPILLDGKYPGREIRADSPKGPSRTRLYLVDNRVYQVSAAGTKTFMDSPQTIKFFDSFQVIRHGD